MILSVATAEMEARNQLSATLGPYASRQKREEPSTPSNYYPGCGAPLGPGHCTQTDGCVFVLRYPDDVQVRRSKEHLPVTKYKSLANAISQYNSHRIDVTKRDLTCDLCSSAEYDPLDLSEDDTDTDAMVDLATYSHNEEKELDSPASVRLIKRQSYRSGFFVTIGEGERARLDNSETAGYLNDSIVTIVSELLCNRGVLGGPNTHAVPTNYYPVGNASQRVA